MEQERSSLPSDAPKSWLDYDSVCVIWQTFLSWPKIFWLMPLSPNKLLDQRHDVFVCVFKDVVTGIFELVDLCIGEAIDPAFEEVMIEYKIFHAPANEHGFVNEF